MLAHRVSKLHKVAFIRGLEPSAAINYWCYTLKFMSNWLQVLVSVCLEIHADSALCVVWLRLARVEGFSKFLHLGISGVHYCSFFMWAVHMIEFATLCRSYAAATCFSDHHCIFR